MASRSERNKFAFAEEFDQVDLGDARRNRRLITVMENLAQRPSAIVQKSQKSWAEMMGAYRFFSNDEVDPQEINEAHRMKTLERMASHERVLLVQDTSSFCFSQLLSAEGLGSIGMGKFGKTGKGIFLHSALAFTPNGTPLGVLGQQTWSRGILKEGDELFENERVRWMKGLVQGSGAQGKRSKTKQVIAIADREADDACYYAVARRQGLEFVSRAKEKLRVSAEGGGKIFDSLSERPADGRFELRLRARQKQIVEKHPDKIPRQIRKAKLAVRFGEFVLNRPAAPSISPVPSEAERTVRAVLVSEENPPKKYDPINWLLFTSLPVESLEDAIAVVDLYRTRWEIEVFHRILKSGCEADKARLTDAASLKRLLACLSVAAWRLHVLTKLQRESPDLPCTVFLEDQEWKALAAITSKCKTPPPVPPTLSEAVMMIAKLGGYLGRKGDGPPGPKSLWEGWVALIHSTQMWLVFNPQERSV